MSRISGRTPEVVIEWTYRGDRHRKRFVDAYKARQFYARQFKAGKHPKVLRSDTMATAESTTNETVTEAPAAKPVKKVPPKKKTLPAVKTKPAAKKPTKKAPAKKKAPAAKKRPATTTKKKPTRKVTKAAKPKTTKKAPAKKAKPAGTADITPNQYAALKALVGERKGIRRSELPEAAGFDKTQTGKVIGYTDPEINKREVHKGNLTNRWFVTQGPEEIDGKNVWMVHITSKGREAYKAAKKVYG